MVLTLGAAMERGGELGRGEVLSLLVRLAFATAASYFTVKLLVSAMDPTSKQKKDAKKKVFQQLEENIKGATYTRAKRIKIVIK